MPNEQQERFRKAMEKAGIKLPGAAAPAPESPDLSLGGGLSLPRDQAPGPPTMDIKEPFVMPGEKRPSLTDTAADVAAAMQGRGVRPRALMDKIAGLGKGLTPVYRPKPGEEKKPEAAGKPEEGVDVKEATDKAIDNAMKSMMAERESPESVDPAVLKQQAPPSQAMAPAGGPATPPGPTAEDLEANRLRGQMAAGIEAAKQAQLEGADARGQDLAAQQAYFFQRSQDMEAQEAGFRKAEVERQAQMRAVESRYRALADDVANQKIDPNRLWASKDTGEKVLHGIGMVIGGFLQGYQGRPDNPFLTQWERSVDRDIAAQKSAIESKRVAADMQSNLYGMMKARFGDARAAEAGAKAAFAQRTIMDVQRMAAASKSTEVQDNAKKLIADLSVKHADWEKDFFLALRGLDLRALAHRGGGGGAGEKQNEMEERWLSEQESKADIPGTMALTDQIVKQYASPELPGTGVIAANVYKKSPAVYRGIYGQKAAEAEQNWHAYKNQMLHDMSGAGVSKYEENRAALSLEGANDPQSRMAAANAARRVLEARLNEIRAGVKPSVVQEHERRKQLYQAPPPPAGFKPQGQ